MSGPKTKQVMPWNVKVGDTIIDLNQKLRVTSIRKTIGTMTGAQVWTFTTKPRGHLTQSYHGKVGKYLKPTPVTILTK